MPDKLNFKGTVISKKAKVDVMINLVQFKDSGSYIIYAPALEIYGYGKTIKEAENSFMTCLEEFVDYTIAKKTIFSEFKRLGWKIKGKKNTPTFKIPNFSDLLVNNKDLINIMNNKEVKTYQTNVPIALPS